MCFVLSPSGLFSHWEAALTLSQPETNSTGTVLPWKPSCSLTFFCCQTWENGVRKGTEQLLGLTALAFFMCCKSFLGCFCVPLSGSLCLLAETPSCFKGWVVLYWTPSKQLCLASWPGLLQAWGSRGAGTDLFFLGSSDRTWENGIKLSWDSRRGGG